MSYKSEYISETIIVQVLEKKPSLCIEYGGLNAITADQSHSILNSKQQVENMSGAIDLYLNYV